MGIEPTSEAWEGLNKTLEAIALAALSILREGLSWKLDGNGVLFSSEQYGREVCRSISNNAISG